MASDSPFEAALAQARRLAAALDAIEARLDALALGADPDEVVAALAEPVRAFYAAAKEALR
jgi:hypothetical protein